MNGVISKTSGRLAAVGSAYAKLSAMSFPST
jgi:hypothetical protein